MLVTATSDVVFKYSQLGVGVVGEISHESYVPWIEKYGSCHDEVALPRFIVLCRSALPVVSTPFCLDGCCIAMFH